ncbi:MAG: GNAT family N-acetyltransferase [Candidatus Aenigmarchaeota archaeon]|nr:GNAT family N-acetyltransferase [Candidatus Aenigmarchaeota archaeon]
MNIEVVDSVDEVEWNNALKKYNFSMLQSHEFSKFVSDSSKYIVARDNSGEIVGGLTYHIVNFIFTNVAQTHAPPFGINDEIKTQVLKEFKKLHYKIKIVNTSFFDEKENIKIFTDSGFLPTEKGTVVVDLKRDLDQLWKNIDKKRRYDIKQSEKLGVKISEQTANPLAWKDFCKIYFNASKEWNGVPLEESYFSQFQKYLVPSGLAKLFLAEYNNQFVSGAIVTISGNILTFLINATDPSMKNTKANSLLVWELIKYGKCENFTYFDLCGYDLHAKKGEKQFSISMFKASFGGVIKRYNKFSSSKLFIILRKFYNKLRIINKLYSFFKKSRV